MKWKESDFNTGIGRIRAVLIYGQDAGQVDEFCDKAVEKLEIDKDNLFALDADELRDKQDALFAESCTPSMFGGRKMVIISGATGDSWDSINDLVSQSGLCATVIVTAGDLRTNNKLRLSFEDGTEIAALPCYSDDAKSLAELIRGELSAAAGIKQITPDALAYMIAHMGEDRAVTRSFLKKIALYVDDKKTVELEDVEKCLPDTAAANMDDFLYSLSAGYISNTMTALDRLLYNGVEPNALIRMLDAHFKKILTAVVDGKIPKLFWKIADKFNQAIKIWTEPEISAVLVRLGELERQLRITGMPSKILLRDFALKLAIHANKLSVRRRKC